MSINSDPILNGSGKVFELYLSAPLLPLSPDSSSVCLLKPEDGNKEQRAKGTAAASQEAPGSHVVPGLLRFGP